MNQGGVPYAISNPPGSTANWHGTPGEYKTDFEANVEGKVEHFDVYGEVQTMYSQVYWTRNNPINLPPDLVERFKGKTMAITGYEIDQVTHSGPQLGSTSDKTNGLGGFSCYPDCEDSDKSVPIYNAYNHHYFSWLVGSDSEMYEREDPLFMPNPTTTGFRTKEGTTHGFPTNIVFKENPGGEYRKSYHGYPNGYAQLIHSPSQWVVEPMQIDTHNRNYGINDEVGLKPSFLPKTFQNNMTDLQNGLSPLIECPCTDRITKSTVQVPSIVTTGTCKAGISDDKECLKTLNQTGISIAKFSVINDPSVPSGCSIKPSGTKYNGVFNAANSTKSCGTINDVGLQGTVKLGELKFHIAHDTSIATMTMLGPSDVWFGIGFDASSMNDAPYTIVIDGNGKVYEKKLANHAPGTDLTSTIRVLSNTVQDSTRIVVMQRSVKGLSSNHYSFPTKPGDVNLIGAIGQSPDYSYHKSHSGGKITLIPTKVSACICQPTTLDYLSYMDTTTLGFGTYDCLDQPRSDMANHGDGTGRQVPNPACHMNTYHGGLQCCRHSWFLTDRDQDTLIPKDKVDTYFLKWRYYFQEYQPAQGSAQASHKHLHHWVFLIDAQVNDYEEDNANYGTESIGKITAHLKAKTMGLEDLTNHTDDGAPPVPNNFTTITPIVMTPHCHAPSCIREEFWNADTNEIICNMTAKYGDEEYGPTTKVFNEKNYISILPCLYGDQPGLQNPFNLTSETNILAVKYFNNTFRHLGQMAQWTGLMVYDTDPY